MAIINHAQVELFINVYAHQNVKWLFFVVLFFDYTREAWEAAAGGRM
jgi:hypothetical protein